MNDAGNPEIISPDTKRANRVPPKQVLTHKWPVLHYGSVPMYAYYDSLGSTLGSMPADWRSDWSFHIWGLVEQGWQCNYHEFRALPTIQVFADMHCVTRWSKLDNHWEGVSTREILSKVKVHPEAKFVMIHCEHGFTTNLPIADFLADDCLFAWRHNGADLGPDHGYPLRLVVPRLYAWKSAKWVRGIELLEKDKPGFWEEWDHGGYHMRGDPWVVDARGDGQRFRS